MMGEVYLLSKFQVLSSYGLGVKVIQNCYDALSTSSLWLYRQFHKGSLSYSVNELTNNKYIYRTDADAAVSELKPIKKYKNINGCSG